MDRRTFIGTLSVTAPAAALAGCETKAPAPAPAASVAKLPGWVPSYFSVEEARLVEAAAERLLPETDTPGATQCEVGRFIESYVSDVYEDAAQRSFKEGIAALDQSARSAHGVGFADAAPAAQLGLLSALVQAAEQSRKEQKPNPAGPPPPEPFILALRSVAINGLCHSKLGATRVLSYEPVPGVYQGCVPLESVGKAWFNG